MNLWTLNNADEAALDERLDLPDEDAVAKTRADRFLVDIAYIDRRHMIAEKTVAVEGDGPITIQHATAFEEPAETCAHVTHSRAAAASELYLDV